jgi:hypothetical protein
MQQRVSHRAEALSVEANDCRTAADMASVEAAFSTPNP